MTSVIKIYTKSKKANKKPGWQKIEAEHNEWLKRMNSLSLFSSKPKAQGKIIDPVVREAFIDEKRLSTGKSLMTPGDTSTKPVYRPEHQYKNNPEMLQRELLAKERKFNIAPTYNKGAEQFITDEMMKDVKAGLNRRRS
jgi:hypothetical protein